ncbi:MAG TPA: signal peptidase I, partial [Acidimicrobiales bacterium]
MTSPHTDAQADAPETDPEDESSGSSRSTTRSVIEWIAVIGGALIVALIIKTFLIQAFYIPSGSMEPTLEKGDRVLVNKISYDLHDVN